MELNEHRPPALAKKRRKERKPNFYISSLLGSLTAFAIMGGLGFVGIIYMLVVLTMSASGGGEKQISVPNNSVLVLDLNMNIADTPPVSGLDRILDDALFGPGMKTHYLLELVDAIDRAKEDSRITALFIHGSLLSENYGSGFATLSELRDSITHFKESGKPVYAYTMDPSMRDYYLMSCADNIVINPFGLVGLNGLSSQRMFLGNAFEKYGVGVQTTRVGKYKSAVEMFTRDSMSNADRTQIKELLDSLWDGMLDEVSLSRGVDLRKLETESDREGFFSANEAMELGLVDEVAYFDEVIETLESVASYDSDIESFKQIDIADYIDVEGFRSNNSFFNSGNQIAVVYAEGDIVNGTGSRNQIGGDRIASLLRDLREDPEVVAVVLRVNSPGGSALAAEVIQREIVMTQKRKPVVVSMGSLAASGGYWISATAEKIYAEPNTITGSIGVWGLLFNFKEIANEHGITFDGVKTAPFADLFTVSREKTPEEMALIQEFTDFIYDQFLEKVATGREMTLEEVHQIAQGRVWTGEQALEIGLIDETGGLEDAIQHAAKLAATGDNWSVRQVPDKRDLSDALEELFEDPGGEPPVIRQKPGIVTELSIIFESEMLLIQSLNDPRGIYARLPFQISF